ncbi:hypothetical protein [Staphylococcus aureus]|uniref:hypothetical protein n=1 Tax=Staphylococcus aureus TaxID=1280 RepID=UPI00044D5D39|nr:hypothetical protein [Staphylococcus aureus]EZV65890.1 hypothetical protein V077_02713 [Staphylococcus aureus 2010-60-6511-39]EZX73562.1 hypothetical protein V110_02745 [Staphylococcus aureus Chi-8]EZY83674.1 hypothetical protein V101_02610 [Staphylococcus aureus Rd.51]KAH95286.1 hypothetical protein W726_02623 [Staphylococcus aureus VET1877R]HBI9243213.1 hypothetical protein [Staphylococcus aureus]
MFFKKNKTNTTQNKIEKHKKNNDLEELDELKDFYITESDTTTDTDLNNDLDTDLNNDLDTKQKYAINLLLFMDNFENLNSSRGRFSTMIDLGIIDQESFEIIDELYYDVETTLDLYQHLNHTDEDLISNLDAKCKNVDYKIRKSLELEKNSLEIIKEAFQKGDSNLGQKGLDQYTKALNIMEPAIEEIKEICIETNTFL